MTLELETTRKKKNYSLQTLEDVHGEVLDGYNFTQEEPHTNPFVRCSNLTLRNCNLKNCDWPKDFIVEEDSCFIGHFQKEIKYTDIEFKCSSGETITERKEKATETKID